MVERPRTSASGDLVELDEPGDLQRLRTPGGDVRQLLALHEHVLAPGVEPLDDVVEGDFLAGPFVHPPVADAVRGAALQLVEVEGVTFRSRVDPDRQTHQSERQTP
jgi:hypothetical protein